MSGITGLPWQRRGFAEYVRLEVPGAGIPPAESRRRALERVGPRLLALARGSGTLSELRAAAWADPELRSVAVPLRDEPQVTATAVEPALASDASFTHVPVETLRRYRADLAFLRAVITAGAGSSKETRYDLVRLEFQLDRILCGA